MALVAAGQPVVQQAPRVLGAEQLAFLDQLAQAELAIRLAGTLAVMAQRVRRRVGWLALAASLGLVMLVTLVLVGYLDLVEAYFSFYCKC